MSSSSWSLTSILFLVHAFVALISCSELSNYFPLFTTSHEVVGTLYTSSSSSIKDFKDVNRNKQSCIGNSFFIPSNFCFLLLNMGFEYFRQGNYSSSFVTSLWFKKILLYGEAWLSCYETTIHNFNKNPSLSIDWFNHSITYELNNCKNFIQCSKLLSHSHVFYKSLSKYSRSSIYSCVIDPALQISYFNIDATQLSHYEWQLHDSILDDFEDVLPNELPPTLPPKHNVDH